MNHEPLEQTKNFTNELKACIECGNCTFWCPIYQEEPIESSVARGKMMMVRELLNGKIPYTQEFENSLNKCLLCMTCSEHCPVGCQVQSAITASRADRVKNHGVGLLSGFVYKRLIPHRTLFGNVVRVASWLQRIFLPHGEGRTRHLPLFLSALGKGREIPAIAPKFLRQWVPVVNRSDSGKPKMRVGFFVGCATDFIFPEVGKKTIDFLTRRGIEVVVPKTQGCCGAPVWLGLGDFETGRRMADKNVEAFKDLDTVFAVCATCASSLKEYHKFLANNSAREEAYKKFSEKVKDVSQLLCDVLKFNKSEYHTSLELRGKKIIWHDPCHANRYLGVREEPREILKSLPDVDYVEMVRADRCCGMAGAFSLHYYNLSKKIADKKADSIKDTEADVVVTGCPGCMIQLMDTLKRHQMPQRVMHLMEVLR
jgi:glycolate oxidase iron-sulfur subunit